MPSSGRKSIACIIGTRPEAVKMAPVVHVLQREPEFHCRLIVTGQHRELLRPMLEFFELEPDVDLDAMRYEQSPTELLARLLASLDQEFKADRPDWVVAQGDTTSVAAAALAAFGRQIPFAHVEAGLRTHELASPFPEEGYRQIAGRLASLHFSPTEQARQNLLGEGIAEKSIQVVGNTVIDALQWAVERHEPIELPLEQRRRLILVTAHRREGLGAKLEEVCDAVAELTLLFEDVEILWPVHPNPSVAPTVHRRLAGRERVHLCEPLSYGRFAAALRRCHFVLTDSGGVQEEAPAFRKPVLVLRDTSERREAIDAGVAQLVGTDRSRILEAACRLLLNENHYRMMSRSTTLYGDGTSARRICDRLGRERVNLRATPALPAAIGCR